MNDIHSITLETEQTGYILNIGHNTGSDQYHLNDLHAMESLLRVAREIQHHVDDYGSYGRDTSGALGRVGGWDPSDIPGLCVDIARTDDRLHQEGLK